MRSNPSGNIGRGGLRGAWDRAVDAVAGSPGSSRGAISRAAAEYERHTSSDRQGTARGSVPGLGEEGRGNTRNGSGPGRSGTDRSSGGGRGGSGGGRGSGGSGSGRGGLDGGRS